jgi:hypothetical protein
MPLCLFAMMDSVMTLREAVRRGKSRPLALQPAVGALTMRAVCIGSAEQGVAILPTIECVRAVTAV